MFKKIIEYIKEKQLAKATEQLKQVNDRIDEIDNVININLNTINDCRNVIRKNNVAMQKLEKNKNVEMYIAQNNIYKEIKEKYDYANTEVINVGIQASTGIITYDKRGSYKEIEKLENELNEQSEVIDKIKENSVVKKYVDFVNELNTATTQKYFANKNNSKLEKEKEDLLPMREKFEKTINKHSMNEKTK